jgi:hypothetical protein
MNLPPDLLAFLQQLLFVHSQQTGRQDDVVSVLSWLLWHSLLGLAITSLGCACLALLVLLFYRPRLTRGSFWMPAFGLFGGTPTLYLHTRPASVCGLFTHSRRLLRHRGKTNR